MAAATFQPNLMGSIGFSSQIAALSICAVTAVTAIFYVASYPSLPWNDVPMETAPAIAPASGTGTASPPKFEIVFSDGDRSLMVYGGYVYIVRLGDKLPDGRRAIGFEKREGSWSAMTL